MSVCLCRYYKAAKLAEALSKEVHYTVDEKQKSVLITEEGYEGAEEVLGVSHPADASVVIPCVADMPCVADKQFAVYNSNHGTTLGFASNFKQEISSHSLVT